VIKKPAETETAIAAASTVMAAAKAAAKHAAARVAAVVVSMSKHVHFVLPLVQVVGSNSGA
jgi:hypothetical protein